MFLHPVVISYKGEVHSGIRSKMVLINHVFKRSQQQSSRSLSGLINYVLDKFILAVTSRVSVRSLQLQIGSSKIAQNFLLC